MLIEELTRTANRLTVHSEPKDKVAACGTGNSKRPGPHLTVLVLFHTTVEFTELERLGDAQPKDALNRTSQSVVEQRMFLGVEEFLDVLREFFGHSFSL